MFENNSPRSDPPSFSASRTSWSTPWPRGATVNPGDHRQLAIPVPIPNTVVKQLPPMIVLMRESRLSPGSSKARSSCCGPSFLPRLAIDLQAAWGVMPYHGDFVRGLRQSQSEPPGSAIQSPASGVLPVRPWLTRAYPPPSAFSGWARVNGAGHASCTLHRAKVLYQ